MNSTHILFVAVCFVRLSQYNKSCINSVSATDISNDDLLSAHFSSFHLDCKRLQHSCDCKAVILVTNLITLRNDPVADNCTNIVFSKVHTCVVNQFCQYENNKISCRFINLSLRKICFISFFIQVFIA
jgi:hypothetical protein